MIAFRLSSEAGLSQYHVLWLRRIGFLAWGVYLFGFFALWLVERELFCVPNGWIQVCTFVHVAHHAGFFCWIIFSFSFSSSHCIAFLFMYTPCSFTPSTT